MNIDGRSTIHAAATDPFHSFVLSSKWTRRLSLHSILMFYSQAYFALLAWTPPPLCELPSEKHYRIPKAPQTLRQLPSIHDAASVDLSVIIPAYNESNRLPSMLSSTLEHLASFPKRSFEILIVDDGSSDGTASAVLKLAAKDHPKADIRVVQLERNRGKGGAVRHGMLHARGRRLLMADADGASRFADVELLLKALDPLAPIDGDAPAVAIGSRAHLVKTDAVVKVCTCSFERSVLASAPLCTNEF